MKDRRVIQFGLVVMVNLQRPQGLRVDKLGSDITWRSFRMHGIIRANPDVRGRDPEKVYVWLDSRCGYVLNLNEDERWIQQPDISSSDIEHHFYGRRIDIKKWALVAESPVGLIRLLPTRETDVRNEITASVFAPIIPDYYLVRKLDDSRYLVLHADKIQQVIKELVFMYAYGSAHGMSYVDYEDYVEFSGSDSD